MCKTVEIQQKVNQNSDNMNFNVCLMQFMCVDLSVYVIKQVLLQF